MVAKIKDLSVFIICRDEADRIGATINSVLPWAGEIVVVDSGSEDDTVNIARGLGARVEHHEWEGYGPQKRYAETLCRGKWLLNIDADEEISPELGEEICALFADGAPDCGAYWMEITTTFAHESRPAPWAYKYVAVRLYRADAGSYSASLVHDRVDLQPDVRTGKLKGLVVHRSLRSLTHAVTKLNDYSTAQNVDMHNRGRILSPWRLLAEFPLAFIKGYVFRRYALYGFWGFTLAVTFAYSHFLRVAKNYEQQLIARRK